VGNCHHEWVDVGDFGGWDPEQSVRDAALIAAATRHFWGELPYERYVFLNVFRPGGGGGLEHSFSTLLTANSRRGQTSYGWRSFVSHEYFHTINVKRLRPVELGPFDYEHPPRTRSLWISEGLTTYFGDLMLVRSGLASGEEFLNAMSGMIRQLQHNPGRLVQSLTDASYRVWDIGRSGVAQDNDSTVSYYVKGPVVGFLLDAKIREATGNVKSLDDVMRAANAKYSGETGFTEQEWRDREST
jgi:predicted metalloprotease with PDZ domain